MKKTRMQMPINHFASKSCIYAIQHTTQITKYQNYQYL